MTTTTTSPAEPTQAPEGTRITVPPRRVRAVSVGLAIAIAFTGTSVGFAIGRLSAPPTGISSGVPGGGFPAPPAAGSPGRPLRPSDAGTAGAPR